MLGMFVYYFTFNHITYMHFLYSCSYRYSGELRDIGIQIDELASFIWENVSYCYICIVYGPRLMKIKIVTSISRTKKRS